MPQITPFRPSTGRTFIVIIVALAAIAGGIAVSSELFDRSQELRAAQAFPEARSLPEFELETAAGEPLTRKDLEGNWSLLFFGFTNCPDICPDTLAVLDAVMGDLDTMGREHKPQVVFVSVDPERDAGEALSEYVAWFNPNFIGATGSPEALESFTRRLGVVYYLGEPGEAGYYPVDHSATVMIVDPRGRLFGRFAPPLDRQANAADLFALGR